MRDAPTFPNDVQRQWIQSAFDHFKSTYVHRDELFQFSTQLADRYTLGRLCKLYLGTERYHPVRGYFQLPTVIGSQTVVDDADKYYSRDRAFELKHGIGRQTRKDREPHIQNA